MEKLPPPPRVPREAIDAYGETMAQKQYDDLPTWIAKPLGRWAFAIIIGLGSLILGSVGGAGVERFASAQEGVVTDEQLEEAIDREREARQVADSVLVDRLKDVMRISEKLDDKLDRVISNQQAIFSEIDNLKARVSERPREGATRRQPGH